MMDTTDLRSFEASGPAARTQCMGTVDSCVRVRSSGTVICIACRALYVRSGILT